MQALTSNIGCIDCLATLSAGNTLLEGPDEEQVGVATVLPGTKLIIQAIAEPAKWPFENGCDLDRLAHPAKDSPLGLEGKEIAPNFVQHALVAEVALECCAGLRRDQLHVSREVGGDGLLTLADQLTWYSGLLQDSPADGSIIISTHTEGVHLGRVADRVDLGVAAGSDEWHRDVQEPDP